MPDGPVAAAIILIAGLVLLALGYFLTEARRSGQRRRHQRGDIVRLPLFGTDRLVARADEADGGDDDAADEDGTPPAAPPRETPVRTGPSAPVERSNGHHAAGSPHAPADHPVRYAEGGSDAPPSDGTSEPPVPFGPPSFAPASGPSSAPSAPSRGPLRRSGIDGPIYSPAAGAATAPLGPMASPSASRPITPSRGAAFVDGRTLSFAIPADGTLQFLPGRLEVVGGPDTGREVRFVRTPGEAVVEVTFGRSEGPPYRHVQLHARTVSRQHATMSLIDQHWQLRNLSTTNPVVLNSRVLGHGEIVPLLVAGDRIEMGEVVFLFHDR